MGLNLKQQRKVFFSGVGLPVCRHLRGCHLHIYALSKWHKGIGKRLHAGLSNCRYPTAFFCYLIPVISRHMVQNKTTLGRKLYFGTSKTKQLVPQSILICLYGFRRPTVQIASQHVWFCNMWSYRAKGLAIRHSHDTYAYLNGFLRNDLNVSQSFYLWRALRWKARFNETLYIDITNNILKNDNKLMTTCKNLCCVTQHTI